MAAKHTQTDLEGLVLGVIGTGAVGSALALGLSERGARVRVWNRSGSVPAALAGARTDFVADLADLCQAVDGVVFAVSDGALVEVARQFAASLPPGRDETTGVALHTAGAQGAEALDALSKRGWSRAQMHPLAAVQSGTAIPPGVWWGVAGDYDAAQLASRLVTALGGEVLALQPGAALRYHLAANLVAGGAVGLVDLALGAMDGVAQAEDSRRALAALLSSTAKNLASSGPGEALTGPQARGEVGIVAAHLETLGELDPKLGEAYRLLSLRMVEIARRRGQDSASGLDELERLLKEP